MRARARARVPEASSGDRLTRATWRVAWTGLALAGIVACGGSDASPPEPAGSQTARDGEPQAQRDLNPGADPDSSDAEPAGGVPDAVAEAQRAAEVAWERAREFYDRAREAGEEAPAGVARWTAEDIGRIGDWEYLSERIETADPQQLTERLNELGAERWEVYWQERSADGESFVVYMKRPARSYLRHVPIGELLRLVPGGSPE